MTFLNKEPLSVFFRAAFQHYEQLVGSLNSLQQATHSAWRWRRIPAAVTKVTSGSWTQLVHVESPTIPHQYLSAILAASREIITKAHLHRHAPIILMGMRAEQPAGKLRVASLGAWARVGHLSPSGA